MSVELEKLVCPLCGSEGGECGHLLARLENDPDEAVIDGGAVIDDGNDLPDQLRVIAEEAVRTGEPVDLGETFATAVEEARSAVTDEGEDIEVAVEGVAPQLAYSLCEQLAERDGVEWTENESVIAVWSDDPAAVVADVGLEYDTLIDELEALDDDEGMSGDEDEDEDDDDDDDEDDEDEEEDA